MKCFEVTINDQDPVVIGDPRTTIVKGSVFLAASGRGGVVFSSYIDIEPGSCENLSWLSTTVEIGDEIRIKLVDSNSPSVPRTVLQHGDAIDPTSPLLACSVCRRSKSQTERLVAAGNISICDQCVALCVETLNQTRG